MSRTLEVLLCGVLVLLSRSAVAKGHKAEGPSEKFGVFGTIDNKPFNVTTYVGDHSCVLADLRAHPDDPGVNRGFTIFQLTVTQTCKGNGHHPRGPTRPIFKTLTLACKPAVIGIGPTTSIVAPVDLPCQAEYSEVHLGRRRADLIGLWLSQGTIVDLTQFTSVNVHLTATDGGIARGTVSGTFYAPPDDPAGGFETSHDPTPTVDIQSLSFVVPWNYDSSTPGPLGG